MNIPKPNLSTVSGNVKRIAALPRKKLLIVLIIGLLLLGSLVGAGSFLYFKTLGKEKFEIVTGPDGKEYIVRDYTTKQQQQGQAISNDEAIKRLNDEIAKKKLVEYSDYVALAQLYFATGDYNKSIENYELAKQAAPPDMKEYKEFTAYVDQVIASLKEMKKQ
jgi:tetratricopeptide (TPR) repeat protein